MIPALARNQLFKLGNRVPSAPIAPSATIMAKSGQVNWPDFSVAIAVGAAAPTAILHLRR